MTQDTEELINNFARKLITRSTAYLDKAQAEQDSMIASAQLGAALALKDLAEELLTALDS